MDCKPTGLPKKIDNFWIPGVKNWVLFILLLLKNGSMDCLLSWYDSLPECAGRRVFLKTERMEKVRMAWKNIFQTTKWETDWKFAMQNYSLTFVLQSVCTLTVHDFWPFTKTKFLMRSLVYIKPNQLTLHSDYIHILNNA